MSSNGSLSSARYPEHTVGAALKDPNTAWRVPSAVRAEDEARFVEAAEAFIHQEHAAGVGARWSVLARTRFEGMAGVLEERACDHLAASDLAALAKVIPECSAADCVDLFRVAELGDLDATERVGRRLATAELAKLPDELYSDALGCRRLYAALRLRFTSVDDELAHLSRAT